MVVVEEKRIPAALITDSIESAVSVLASLAIENIFLSKKNLADVLRNDFGIFDQTNDLLVEIFGRNGNGKP